MPVVDGYVMEGDLVVHGPMEQFFQARQEWSFETFGAHTERGPEGPLKHLEKEVKEAIAAWIVGGNVLDFLEELVDCQFLVHDAVSRAGFTYDAFLDACWKKLAKNRTRRWGARSADGVVEHIREEE